jgi:hypothetical protein
MTENFTQPTGRGHLKPGTRLTAKELGIAQALPACPPRRYEPPVRCPGQASQAVGLPFGLCSRLVHDPAAR